MEKRREAIARIFTAPTLTILIAALYLFAPLAFDQLRGPEYWMRVNSVTVPDTATGQLPQMAVDRQIIRPFQGTWHVMVRRQQGEFWAVTCAASGGGNYRTDAVLPDPVTLAWWTEGKCVVLEPGKYQISTSWNISPKSGAEKRLLVESNIFEVTQ